MHLYMIRHGQSYVNLKDWANGNTDEGLTDLGQQQAAALAGWLPTALPQIDVIYASTMKRARETVAPLAQAYNADIRFDDRLREMGNNRLDHTPWPNDNLPKEYSEFWGSERPFSSITPKVEGGESYMHFRIRIGAFIQELVERHRGQIVVAVCHGGVLDATFDHIFNIGPWRRAEAWMHNTAISHFEYVELPSREVWRLHFHNRVEHLREVEGPKRESGTPEETPPTEYLQG
ncbi:MAG TPA: histidine phosphatase family protein [Ardenticatenaceae bacterium]|jgi:probable phosphoglycerate mutase